MLLDQETQLISAIGRHKLEAGTENKDKRIQDFLDKVRGFLSFFSFHSIFLSFFSKHKFMLPWKFRFSICIYALNSKAIVDILLFEID